MILKRQRSGRGTRRVNASHQAACSRSHAGADAGVCGRQRQSQLYRRRPQGDLWLRRGNLAGPAVPAAVEEGQRRRAALSGHDQRAQLGADHAPDPALPPKWVRAASKAPAASLPGPLQPRRHSLAGGRRCRPRGAVGAGAAAHPPARVHRLRPPRVPALAPCPTNPLSGSFFDWKMLDRLLHPVPPGQQSFDRGHRSTIPI